MSTFTINLSFSWLRSKKSIFSQIHFLIKFLKSFVVVEFELTLKIILKSLLRKYASRILITITIILSFSDWLLENCWLNENSAMNVISFVITCLLYLMIELNLIMKSSINSKKNFSNFNTIFLKIALSVIQSVDQKCNTDASEKIRVRSMFERIDDFDWLKIISASLIFVANFIKVAYWWSVSMNSIISKVKHTNFSLIVKMSNQNVSFKIK